MIEHAQLLKKIIPVVNHVVAASEAEQRQFLRARVRHVCRDRQKLLEHEEEAKRASLHLAMNNEIRSEQHRNEQLQNRAAGHHHEFSEHPKQSMPALMDGNEYQ